MAFERRSELWTYDVFPKVVTAGKKTTVHIRKFGGREFFVPGSEYTAQISWLNGGQPQQFTKTGYRVSAAFVADEKGIDVEINPPSEGEYRILFKGEKDNLEFAFYAVDGNLVNVYPFIGDLHMHTNCSDGRHDPENVAASYRSHGYDFLAMTDHKRYYPSLYAMESFKNIPTEFNLVPGEEIHLPPINGEFAVVPHTVNFGGEYSINSLVEDVAVSEVGKDKSVRSVREDCPEVMTKEEFSAKMTELAKDIEVPDNMDAITAATIKWIYDEIRKADGLAIFPHPTWITGQAFHDSDAFNDWMVENKIFDAFEVLGGENYFEQNGFQTVRYYEDMARGYKYPIVGSTDSHNCTPENRNAFICSTIVFSPQNERKALIESIKDFRSVAVDTISKEFRLVGEMRYVRYACFLLKNYFPIHDDACFEEGRLMKQAIYGSDDEKQNAIATLTVMNGRMKKMREKYFEF